MVVRRPVGSPGSKLIGLLRYALDFVTTPFVCAVQHDMPFRYPGTINHSAIALDMARFPELKYVSPLLCIVRNEMLWWERPNHNHTAS
jgi:hypothetical protein